MKSTKRMSEAGNVAVLFVGLMIALCLWPVQESMSAGSSGSTNSKSGANADTGRSIFNGKGLCYYCHGMDGDVDKRPQLAPDTAAFIAELDPKDSQYTQSPTTPGEVTITVEAHRGSRPTIDRTFRRRAGPSGGWRTS